MEEINPDFNGEEILIYFVEKMMRDKGEEAIDEGEKQRLINELNEMIEDAMMKALPDDKLLALSEITGDSSEAEEKIDAILFGSGLDLKSVIGGAMNRFRKEYLGEKA